MTFYPPNSVYFTKSSSVENITECLSVVNVDSLAHNFQLNKLKLGGAFDKAESGDFTRNMEASPIVRCVKLISGMVSELIVQYSMFTGIVDHTNHIWQKTYIFYSW